MKKLLLVVIFVVGVMVLAVYAIEGDRNIKIVRCGEVEIRVTYIHTHPFLAEYERHLELLRNGESIGKQKLFPDPGGGFPSTLQCYGAKECERVRYTDNLGSSYLFDAKTGEKVKGQNPYDGKLYVNFVKEEELPPLLKEYWISSFIAEFEEKRTTMKGTEASNSVTQPLSQ